MNGFEKLVKAIEGCSLDASKFYEKGNKAAGRRVRAAMMDVKRLAVEIRKEIAQGGANEEP